MSFQPFYITAFEQNSGLNTYFESFLIPEKAFPTLEDAYCFRGRVKKRQGFFLLGRLQRTLDSVSLGNSGASPWTFVIYSTLTSPITGEPNAQINPGTVTITIQAGPNIVFTDNGDGTLSSVTVGNSGTINYATGSVTLTHTAGAGVPTIITFSYFPGLPVMGLATRETTNINTEELIAFDTKYAYHFVVGPGFQELPSVSPTTWQGSDSNFFWTTTYWNINGFSQFWATNFNKSATPDPIRYWDGTTWTDFAPLVNGATRLQQALILVPYKDSLIALNTYEGTTLANATHNPQRARWNRRGSDPRDQIDNWLDTNTNGGGFIDAPTNDVIVAAEFVKDVLVVKFQESTWKLVFTNNPSQPFVWQKVNTELGASSTFTLIPFDQGIFGIGNRGVTTDDSVNVTRIDVNIPDIVFGINGNNQGVQRVQGIRDYTNELALWTYPDAATNPIYPNKMLVYNYRNSTWAIFNDSFTTLGYISPADYVWSSLPFKQWSDWDSPWNSPGIQTSFPDIVAGNQQGFVEILFKAVENDVSLFITAVTPSNTDPVQITVPNHNLQSGQFIIISGIIGTGSPSPTALNGVIFRVEVIDANTLQLFFLNNGVIEHEFLAVGGTYLGGGQIEVFNNINITTKIFAPFYEAGKQGRLGYVDFLFDTTENGQLSVNLFLNESDSVIVDDDEDPNIGLLGTNIISTAPESTDIPYQPNQNKIWHRFYTYAIAQNFQIQLTLSDLQMFQDLSTYDVELHAMTLYLSPNARMIQ